MTLPTFIPPRAPNPGTKVTPEVKILFADFGDGYTQAAPDGLNNLRKVVTLTWDYLMPAEGDGLYNFMASLGGCLPFLYQLSDDPAGPLRWTCKEFSQTRGTGGLREFTATFRRDFNLDG